MGAGQSRSQRVAAHIRNNIWGIVAVFIALGGTATALDGKNTVDSGDIKKANVKRSDLAPNSVDSSKVVDASLTGVDVGDNSLTGADVDEGTLNLPPQPTIPSSLPPSGPAGGDLSGSYPDPQVLESGLASGGDLSGPLSAAQVSEGGITAGGDLNGSLAGAQIDANAVGDAEIADRTRQTVFTANDLQPVFTITRAPANGLTNSIPSLDFDETFAEDVLFVTEVPTDRAANSTISLSIFGSATASNQFTVQWTLESKSLGLGESVTATPFASQGFVNSGFEPGSDNKVLESCCFTIQSNAVANGDTLVLHLARDPANDTLAVEMRVYAIVLEYTAVR